jgi:Holliday junction resolvase RusA-like endonuclease
LSAEAQKASIKYKPSDRLQIAITLYMPASALHSHDVDNRLKDIMDALQGRTGGSKKIRLLNPIIPNDRQIYRVTIEKKTPPKQSKGLGHITISKYGDV